MKTIQLVGTGGGVGGNNPATLTPIAPPYAPGDLVVIVAGSRAVSTVTVAQPLGWRQLGQYGGLSIIGRIMGSWTDGVSDAMPVLRFLGGAAGDDGLATTYSFRFTHNSIDSIVNTKTALQANAAAQDILCPTITTTSDGTIVLTVALKQDDLIWYLKGSSVALASSISTAGNDASLILVGEILAAAGAIPAETMFIGGGGAAASWSFLIALLPYVTSLPYPVATDRPCDFAAKAREGLNALSVKLTGLKDDIDAVFNRQAYRLSNNNFSVAQGAKFAWSSVDIDPTGIADLVIDPNSVTLPDGLWITGASSITAYTGTAGNHIAIFAGDAAYGSSSRDMDATGYPTAGGTSTDFSYVHEAVPWNQFIYVQMISAGVGVPDPQTVVFARCYAVRMCD